MSMDKIEELLPIKVAFSSQKPFLYSQSLIFLSPPPVAKNRPLLWYLIAFTSPSLQLNECTARTKFIEKSLFSILTKSSLYSFCCCCCGAKSLKAFLPLLNKFDLVKFLKEIPNRPGLFDASSFGLSAPKLFFLFLK